MHQHKLIRLDVSNAVKGLHRTMKFTSILVCRRYVQPYQRSKMNWNLFTIYKTQIYSGGRLIESYCDIIFGFSNI